MSDEIVTAKFPAIEKPEQEKPEQEKPRKLARERDLVFFDIETTGLIPGTHEILEIAGVRLDIESLDEVASFEARVFPRRIETASPEALAINGYDAEAWKTTALPLEVALFDFVEICKDQVTLVGHNPVFDWAFVRPALAEFDLLAEVDYHVIDTASLAWPIAMSGAIDRVKLAVLCDHLGIDNEGEHRALTDCRRAADAYRKMMRMYDWNEVQARTAEPLATACRRLREVWQRTTKVGSIYDESDVVAAVGQILLPALFSMETKRNDYAAKLRERTEISRARRAKP